jgi:hypothetical protein
MDDEENEVMDEMQTLNVQPESKELKTIIPK